MRVCWTTDIHLNFVPFPALFGKELAGEKADGVLITGDISECHRLSRDLLSLREGIGTKTPIWFLLGNHDAYQGSVMQAKSIANKMNAIASNLIYIGSEEHKGVELVEGTWLIGVDGWYSATAGTPFESNVQMSDFSLISEMLVTGTRDPRDLTAGRVAAARRLASDEADIAKTKLAAILRKKPKRVVLATHVPPYAQASFHMKGLSDDQWLPWFTNTLLGDLLDKVAAAHPEVLFDVVCGHMHTGGVYHRAENVSVTVGAARYAVPAITAMLEF